MKVIKYMNHVQFKMKEIDIFQLVKADCDMNMLTLYNLYAECVQQVYSILYFAFDLFNFGFSVK